MRISAVPNLQRVAMRGQGGPDIVIGQSFAHTPIFVENADGAFGLNASEEMYSPGGNGQGIAQAVKQDLCQAGPVFAATSHRAAASEKRAAFIRCKLRLHLHGAGIAGSQEYEDDDGLHVRPQSWRPGRAFPAGLMRATSAIGSPTAG